MIRINNIKLPLDYTDYDLQKAVSKELRINKNAIDNISLYKRSVDARHKNDVHFIASVDVQVNQNESTVLSKSKCSKASIVEKYKYVLPYKKDLDKRPVVIGFGPAGIFCALILAQAGQRPIVIEQGQDVDKRTKCIENLWSNAILNPRSNVQFGEGGAGTFSDGKLNTSTKDSRQRKVLEEFTAHGAPDEIMYNAKPHIGTDKLRGTIKNLRQEIIRLGGEVRFESKFVDFKCKDNKLCCVTIENNNKKYEIETDNAVLCIGHSSRDTFELLKEKGMMIEPKAFSVGVRIEHLQDSINRTQYGDFAGNKNLGAADYKLNTKTKNGRNAYTFCMCPGGSVVASQSEENTVVTNGMSYFSRDKENSNSALLVNVYPTDFSSDDVLSGVEYQRKIERAAFVQGGSDYHAPVCRVEDFLNDKVSTRFGDVVPSYRPGTKFADITKVLPDYVTDALKDAIINMDKKLSGFAHPDAVLTGAETRSSSPIRILRDETMQSISIKGLYPCGEGAGYAGGIISAAVDGIKVAEQILINA